ncbi:MAG: hypothetical protein JW993_18610 [Sedimentisphaerales bacterium]|nr:hypothetical protein [Sedimentisphaerales bacterium]
MRRTWAVAKNTIRQALRMKVAIIFVVLLLVLLPIMGLTATGDGTLKGRLQTFVSYGLSLTSLLLCLLTIIVSIYTVTSDIEQRQIYTVVTKPIRRYELILGKLLGVIVLDVGLLVVFAGIVYSVTVFMPEFFDASDAELHQVKNEFYTARASLVPPELDVSQEVQEVYDELEKDGQLEAAYPNMTREEILDTLTARKRLEKQAVAAGGRLLWEFENVRPLDPNQSLFIRFKYDVSVTPPDGDVYGIWQIGDLRQFQYGGEIVTPIWPEERRDPIRTFREIEVPARVIAADGYLGVEFINNPYNQTVVIFPVEDGLEVLYKAGTFTGNFIKAALLILCRLVFLSCLGVLAASFLSFPVAILFCLVIFTIGTVSGFVLESFDMLSHSIGLVYTYTIGAVIRLLPRFDQYNPTAYLVPARLLTWSLLGRVLVFMVCIKALVLLALALLIFSFRELAKIIV